MSESATFLLDVNALVALALPQHTHHFAAHAWIGNLAKKAKWASTPVTEAAFIRLLLNPAVTGGQGYSFQTAATQLNMMKHWPGATHEFLPDASSLAEPSLAPELLVAALVGHRQVTDFHLLNLAAANGCRLATFDTAFSRAVPQAEHLFEVIPALKADSD
ncbi:MAG: VapC toxin family PIN domain ribonuclease [Propionibacteriaceae bacterium]|jgi:toxin-antitoxin system PIN domain toxin|nr:VapC toxin family PIN domain ribonuclease [Propionibacteriaceae bacterium]